MNDEIMRCWWCGDDPLYRDYHDNEWGRPERDERKLFESLCLEGAQAGLSWITVLRKREHYRKVYADFDIAAVATFDDAKQAELLLDAGIIRNRLKVNAFRENARAVLALHEQGTSLSEVVWQVVNDQPVINNFQSATDVPAQTAESQQLSKSLKKHGFRFVGPTICYAFMQANGLVMDHLCHCSFRDTRCN